MYLLSHVTYWEANRHDKKWHTKSEIEGWPGLFYEGLGLHNNKSPFGNITIATMHRYEALVLLICRLQLFVPTWHTIFTQVNKILDVSDLLEVKYGTFLRFGGRPNSYDRQRSSHSDVQVIITWALPFFTSKRYILLSRSGKKDTKYTYKYIITVKVQRREENMKIRNYLLCHTNWVTILKDR